MKKRLRHSTIFDGWRAAHLVRYSSLVLFASCFLALGLSSSATAQSKKAKTKSAAKPTSVTKDGVTTATQKEHKLTDTVGIVNGVVVRLYDFREALSNAIRLAATEKVVTDTEFTHYVNKTWHEMVADIMSQQEIEKRELELSDAEVMGLIKADPPPFLRDQFTDTTGNFRPDLMGAALDDPRNDSTVTLLRLSAKVQLEHLRLLQSIAPEAKSMQEMQQAFDDWLRKKIRTSEIDDRRMAFGYY